MFDFEPTQAQRRLIDAARDFARHRVMPIAASSDESSSFPVDLVGEAHALGLLNVTIPSDCGGPELGHLESGFITEQLAYACSGIQASLTANVLATTALRLAGSASQKRKYLGWVAREPVMAAFAASEAEAGSDLAAMKCRGCPGRSRRLFALWHEAMGHQRQPRELFHRVRHRCAGVTSSWNRRVHRRAIAVRRHARPSGTQARPTAPATPHRSNCKMYASQPMRFWRHRAMASSLAMDTFTRTRPEIAAAAAGLMRSLH